MLKQMNGYHGVKRTVGHGQTIASILVKDTLRGDDFANLLTEISPSIDAVVNGLAEESPDLIRPPRPYVQKHRTWGK